MEGLFAMQLGGFKKMSIKKSKKGKATDNFVRLKDFPKRCFISHSYKNKAAAEKLCSSLPKDVVAVKFPRVEPLPNKAVSNQIIPKILNCSGLIYLTSNASKLSFWVSFEKDYALRSRRKVFAYNSRNRTLQRDHSRPLPLKLTVCYHSNDSNRVNRLLSWMAEKRYFKIEKSIIYSNTGSIKGDILAQLEDLLVEEGVVLWLMSLSNIKVVDVFYSEDYVVKYLKEDPDKIYKKYFQDLYDLGEGEKIEEYMYYDLYSNVYDVFARIDPDLPPEWRVDPFGNRSEYIAEGGTIDPDPITKMIDLYEGMEGKDFNWNRIDDLIIRLYERLLQVLG